MNNKQVCELYQELHRFILQFPKEYCNFYVNWSDYLISDWNKIQSIRFLEYPNDNKKDELGINEETIMLYLEHFHACRFQKPFNGKFYRETGTDKKKIAQNINNQSNRRIIQNFLNHGIPFIDAKEAPNPELYEVADFLAYISGFCLHESQKKVFRQLNKEQLFKGRKFLEWYNAFPEKQCYNLKLCNDVKNMQIENDVFKWNII